MKDKLPRIPLEKLSLPELLAGKLKQLILEKKWTHELPGIRALSETFGVSTLVVKQALEQLEQEGLLDPAEKGKARHIHLGAVPPDSASDTLILLRPYEHLMSTLTDEVYETSLRQLIAMEASFREIAIDVKDGSQFSLPSHEDVSQITNLKGVIACDVAHDKAREAFGPDVPMLVMGPKLIEDSRCASVALSISDTFAKLIHHLLQLGLSFVPILTSYPTKAFHAKLSHLTEEIYASHQLRYREELHLPYSDYSNLESVISRILDYGLPEAVICLGNDQWCFLTHYFMQRGLKVEVLCLFETPLFRLFKSKPYVCQPLYEDYASALCDWLTQLDHPMPLTFNRKVGCRFSWEKKK